MGKNILQKLKIVWKCDNEFSFRIIIIIIIIKPLKNLAHFLCSKFENLEHNIRFLIFEIEIL